MSEKASALLPRAAWPETYTAAEAKAWVAAMDAAEANLYEQGIVDEWGMIAQPAPDALRDEGGSLCECPLVGVHAHSFRGPHTFREWEPGTGPGQEKAWKSASTAVGPSGSASTSAVGSGASENGSPSVGLASEQLRNTAQAALDRGESVGKYHQRAVINALAQPAPDALRAAAQAVVQAEH